MKVLKFGGTSVGTPDSMMNVKHIVESHDGRVVVVVSALGGVTDQLIWLGHAAAAGDVSYKEEYERLCQRHADMIRAVVPDGRRQSVTERVDALLAELGALLHGVFLLQDLTQKSADAIVAYGERMSSLIVAAVIEGATHIDAREMVKTMRGGRTVDVTATNELITERLGGDFIGTTVLGGFIASDVATGRTTNLGRGGSDYTAALIAAALDAETLEIWTDVDGFMTADPRVIPTAVVIPQLSYGEAMELCNFGAKVVYPPTIYPVCAKSIPILIKNTHRPEAPGSIICRDAARSESLVRGISSVNETSLVTVHGLSMVGVVGVNRRIFTTLAEGGVSVFLVAQSSSETSTSLCVTPEDGRRACEMLDSEFASEIAAGAMSPCLLTEGLATIACVGENMTHVPGILGKIFAVLGRNGINVAATALGALEKNISFVVEQTQLRKALNVLHDSVFLSRHEELNIFLCGTGTVGGKLLEQLAKQREQLMQQRGLKLNLVGVSGSSWGLYDREGLDPATVLQQRAAGEGEKGGIREMVAHIKEMNIFNSVFVDCTASPEVASYYEELLSANVNVVAANKIAASSSYDRYSHLKELARQRGVKFLFETNVGAGLPIINTINDLTASGDRVLGIEAVLSGTLNYVFNVLSPEVPLSQAVRMAKENGYSEPDPRIDLSGMDVLRKLTILARESGYHVETDDIERRLFIPQTLFDGTEDAFWEGLTELDDDFEADRARLAAEGKRWRFVAELNAESGKLSVGLREIPQGHPLYDLEGSNNIVCLTTERYHQEPMLIQGYGAGAAVTAAGVFADILRII